MRRLPSMRRRDVYSCLTARPPSSQEQIWQFFDFWWRLLCAGNWRAISDWYYIYEVINCQTNCQTWVSNYRHLASSGELKNKPSRPWFIVANSQICDGCMRGVLWTTRRSIYYGKSHIDMCYVAKTSVQFLVWIVSNLKWIHSIELHLAIHIFLWK